jgi:hypothetical protein
MQIELNNKTFRSTSNSSNGEVSEESILTYFQQDNIIWAEYGGGQIVKGFLIGKIVDDHLELNYQHINRENELMTGKCVSYLEIMENGKIRLKEYWQWTCKDNSNGESIISEV